MKPGTVGGVVLVGLAALLAGLGVRERRQFVSNPRGLVTRIARNEIGRQDPARYWAGVLPSGPPYPDAWCGGFSLWVLKQAGLADDIQWEIGRGYCYRLPRTNTPEPGDIAYIDQPYQHHAIVDSVMGDTVTTIDGNQPGETVAMRSRSKSAAVYYSIAPLIDRSRPIV